MCFVFAHFREFRAFLLASTDMVIRPQNPMSSRITKSGLSTLKIVQALRNHQIWGFRSQSLFIHPIPSCFFSKKYKKI